MGDQTSTSVHVLFPLVKMHRAMAQPVVSGLLIHLCDVIVKNQKGKGNTNKLTAQMKCDVGGRGTPIIRECPAVAFEEAEKHFFLEQVEGYVKPLETSTSRTLS